MGLRVRVIVPVLLGATLATWAWAVADPFPQGTVTSTPTGPVAPIQNASSTPPSSAAVVWAAGPWGEVTIAGHRLVIPASAIDGPLVDHGQGWISGYQPTALAAAIAVMRNGLMVTAAPPVLQAQVDADTLTEAARAGLGATMRNAEPGWVIPAPTLAAANTRRVRLLGVAVELHGRRARATVYQATQADAGDTLSATGYQLAYADDQWRIDTVEPTTAVAAIPEHLTLPAPSQECDPCAP